MSTGYNNASFTEDHDDFGMSDWCAFPAAPDSVGESKQTAKWRLAVPRSPC